MGSGGVAIAALPTVICLKVPFSDGLGGGFFVFLAVLMIIPRILLICILVISILIAIFATEALPIFATISILNINITN